MCVPQDISLSTLESSQGLSQQYDTGARVRVRVRVLYSAIRIEKHCAWLYCARELISPEEEEEEFPGSIGSIIRSTCTDGISK